MPADLHVAVTPGAAGPPAAPVTATKPITFSSISKGMPTAAASAHASGFLPTLLLALAFVGWLSFQALQLLGERQQLGVALAGLEPQEQAATKLRASLDAVASATASLATAGNANARVVVEELRKRGVTINPAGTASPAK